MKSKSMAAIMAGIITASSVSFAWFGGDDWEPLDPSTYWDLWTIDWADTNDPGHYFYGDLANNGMQVHDESRKLKSIEYLENLLNQLGVLTNRVQLDELNTTPLDKSELARFKQNTDAITVNTYHIADKTRDIFDDNDTFRTVETAMNTEHVYNVQKQAEYSEEIYKKVIEASKIDLADIEYRNRLLEDSLNVSGNAVGELAAIQADTQVNNLYVQELIRNNALLNNYLALLTLEAKKKEDARLAEQESVFNMFSMKFRDPYNPEEDNAHFEKPEARGFVHFE